MVVEYRSLRYSLTLWEISLRILFTMATSLLFLPFSFSGSFTVVKLPEKLRHILAFSCERFNKTTLKRAWQAQQRRHYEWQHVTDHIRTCMSKYVPHLKFCVCLSGTGYVLVTMEVSCNYRRLWLCEASRCDCISQAVLCTWYNGGKLHNGQNDRLVVLGIP